LRSFLTFYLAILMLPLWAQGNPELKFRADRTFRILQFTDLHWDSKSAGRMVTEKTIRSVIVREKPDLIVITGDIVTEAPAEAGWNEVAGIFSCEKIPWTVTLGNHDSETGISRDQIFDLLSSKPYFAGSKGPELTGCGNYILTVRSSDGRNTAAAIYCFDSNDYPESNKTGHYDWIHFDQIEWYRKTSDEFKARNNGMPLPAVAFFHIPLPEFETVSGIKGTIGPRSEGTGAPVINSGLFASMVEKENIMGIFVGHAHENNYSGILNNICLAFGRTSGNDAYGSLERGGRVIELHENDFSFNTWVRTPSEKCFDYNYPSGLETDPANVSYLPSKLVSGLKQGLRYKYYEGRFSSVEQIEVSGVKKSGVLKNVSIANATVADSFAFVFNAWIKIPEKAVYSFYTFSDDGSRLYIDGRMVVDNDGSHSAGRADGTIALAEGYHDFKLLYFEDYSGSKLEVGFSGIAIKECRIPDNLFYIESGRL
jgi:hypothetical protein